MLAYQLGDESAFRELYSRHSGRVLAFLRSKVRNEVKARDIFQSTFLKLHRSRGRYNPSLPFVPWLFTICRSELLDAIKKEQLLKEELTSEVSEGVHETPVNVDLSELDPRQKQAIEMRFTNGLSFEDIARALETTPANARQIIARAIRNLRKIYGKK